MSKKPKINPHPVINQSNVIDILNKYLDWHNLPLRMNRTGICNGLATVYAKYALEGRQEEFREMLIQVATMSPSSELDLDVNHFVTEIVLSFLPDDFNKEKNQFHSIESLQIDGQKIRSSFEFGLVTSDENWATIIRNLDIKDDEAMLVRSVNHAITVTKKNGRYIVYDPNYSAGFKAFTNEKKLIDELHNQVFQYIGPLAGITDEWGLTQDLSGFTGALGLNGSLGMLVQVVSHPQANTPREFPAVKDLYKEYMNPNQIAQVRAGFINNLDVFTILENIEILNDLFNDGLKLKNPVKAAHQAIAYNSISILEVFLNKIPKKDEAELETLFSSAFTSGRMEAFEVLLKNDSCSACFNKVIMQEKNAANFIKEAAFGGNIKLLQQLMEAYKINGKPEPLSDIQLAEKIQLPQKGTTHGAIQMAILGRSLDSVKFLLTKLEEASRPLDEKQLLINLMHSIVTNQPQMVDFFVEKIKTTMPEKSQNIFSSITMSTSLVERSDLSILRKLKSCHVNFTETAEGIIKIKENRAVGYLLPMAIMLNKFTDFIKETFLQRDDLTDSIKKFKEFKGFAKEINPEPTLEENNASHNIMNFK